MSLLTPDIGLLFWMTLSFGIVFFILAKYGFPVISRAVEKRNQYINDSLQAAREAEARLAKLNAEGDAILEQARSERNALLHEAQEMKQRIISDAKETAEATVRLQKERAAVEIEETKKKALGEIKDQIAGISVAIAGKVLANELKESEQQNRLIDRLLDEELTLNN
ncbi:F-type H+-transporting ATPase subunit b [Parabacteroides sp. PF5-5]|uniref:F0F1 ATP synthase subunit B n=1 Tax=unclassified Parabacteroides TaxID=2649774 RepID=UPI002475C002|nr:MULTISPECIES: F0F1 ATP synthase subunit B [unclassified Parabacteroides]MDH6304751.1 F-type H+-transporting ATPase subunit b [Parabacteroides sp. PH5-39]MDH6315634.1 F-type H+-transporting ATPase subunit b [Parabacteroides sp. PF5-13]MDH6319295.1 F-type H+-transporting ATPase subunit b [Parabacteroides sp. PH5-13]MDH6323026.1 F-type H+-transporting ATPase subunit b [Parabacteroides sp. PH5-8]MDH6326827.1 F-type H+-transporting ATPase subunit b [Parabacteroides sp. PH5-41]